MNKRMEKMAKRIAVYQQKRGFVLLEWLVVLVIIGILTAIAIPVFWSLLCSHEGNCNE